jgi:CBS domain containing-hemolysin-like protein
MPYVGEQLTIDRLHVEVLEVERRRITKVRVKLAEGAPAATEE